VAVSVSSGLERLSFADRPQYSSPYPLGIAVGRAAVTGDASGGGVTMTLLSDGGFLFRLELLSLVRGDVTSTTQNIITSHRWAGDRSPAASPTDFDLNWHLTRVAQGGFSVSRANVDVMSMIRRFPMGRTDNVALQVILSASDAVNTDTVTYEFHAICTYWRKEALQRPGFLASYYEAPEVPLVPALGR